MRFLLREKPYEKVVASGRYRYEKGDQPTGAVESWRLTTAVDGYRFLRVDLDARDADSGDSYLYHLTLNPAGQPERLGFRFFRPGLTLSGNVLFDAGAVTVTREVNGRRFEEETTLPPTYAFWFPAAAGLGLLSPFWSVEEKIPAVTLDKEQRFALWFTEVTLRSQPATTMTIMGQAVTARPVMVQWVEQERIVWFDEHDWPVKVQRGDLTATEVRYVRYGADSR